MGLRRRNIRPRLRSSLRSMSTPASLCMPKRSDSANSTVQIRPEADCVSSVTASCATQRNRTDSARMTARASSGSAAPAGGEPGGLAERPLQTYELEVEGDAVYLTD